MSDELTFLRWCYVNSVRFFETVMMHIAYEAETGNKVPADYRIAA